MNQTDKEEAEKYLGKVQDEVLEEEQPDQNRIAKWLFKGQTFIGHISKIGALYDKAKEAFGTFNIPM